MVVLTTSPVAGDTGGSAEVGYENITGCKDYLEVRQTWGNFLFFNWLFLVSIISSKMCRAALIFKHEPMNVPVELIRMGRCLEESHSIVKESHSM